MSGVHRAALVLLSLLALGAAVLVGADPAAAAVAPEEPAVTIELDGDPDAVPSQAIIVILGLTLLSLAPALLVLMTSFTRIAIVLSLTRNALGLQAIPPNPVIVGLALFLSLFVMSPVLSEVWSEGLSPFLDGLKDQETAYADGIAPLRDFMLAHVGRDELALFMDASGAERPDTPQDVSMATLVPAFVISELKTAFIIGFIIFIPFLVIDIVVSSTLMSMGMMMLPPVLISLPFKILLFVLVDGWSLIAQSLLNSYA
ncbi:flagellar type III secretion system pore protein FliP [Quadrisphaera sp. GCM10027208]|uniref:flagellar type III secretion system pore protein FliP n=1 Tax=Quadrisphaera sp. GCM10027208 TaxID=3273423 RepID=UPI0036181418|nr:flagellar type III secretion system pore protein FliP [Kineosporiaceae bacterium SCSIO 59966]